MKLSDINPNKRAGQAKSLCPECSHLRKKKKDPCLSVNLDSGAYKCFNCGITGILDEYKTYMKKETDYTLPPQETVTLSGAAFDYFRQRGVSLDVVKQNKITSSPKSPDQWVAFNYYENGVIVNIKFRHVTEKRFIQSPNGKQIFYGETGGFSTLVITEGEMDKLSFDMAGIPAVSVPMGAPNVSDASVDGKLRCLTYAEEDVNQTQNIILACDDDPNGRRLTDELARRIGYHKCKRVEYPDDCKDANDVLQKFGVEKLVEMVENAKPFPLSGVSLVDDYEDELNDLYDNGLPQGHPVGYPHFDSLFKFHLGYLITITGIPSHGKSNFVEQMVILLAAKYGFKFAMFSPEHYPPAFFIHRLAKIYTGLPMFGEKRMNKPTLDMAKEFLNKHFFIIHADGDHTLDKIHEIAQQLVYREGIHGLVIDPWTDVEYDDPNAKSETRSVAIALQRIKNFNRKNKVTTFLVAHPTKMMRKEDGSYQVPTMYSISGSANFYNKTDFGWSVYRHDDDSVTVYVQKVKFEDVLGKKGSCLFTFDKLSSRYKEIGSDVFSSELNFDTP